LSARAGRQLVDLADISNGAIELLHSSPAADGATLYTVSLDTSGIVTSNGGIRIRARERFEIYVDSSYPYSHPTVMVSHRRWAGTPHVQWGKVLCLYAAPSVEWNPDDGMRGLISRLSLWLQRAAEGDLDPAGQPLHPPVAYNSYKNGWVVIRPDVGELAPWRSSEEGATSVVFGLCVQIGQRVDVLEWLTRRQVIERLIAETLNAEDSHGRPLFVAPLLMISQALDMEYPSDASLLAEGLQAYGISRENLLTSLVDAARINKMMAASPGAEREVPGILFLATPARRLEPGNPLAHITAWHLDKLGTDITDLLEGARPEQEDFYVRVRDLAHSWLGLAKVQWMVIHEARPEVTRRRDTGSPSTWISGKNILVLGCGALGAPIAEQCVRAGAGALHVVDKGVVTPGILVRQHYEDADIGYNKAERLAGRLSRIRPDFIVTSSRKNVVTGLLNEPELLTDYDLIVDATADIGVRAALEHARAGQRDRWPVTVGALFGHTAECGLATVSLPGATGCTHDILRRAAIDIVARAPLGWASIGEDLFPKQPRTDRFFPEPGCSAPTFVGSATQVNTLASALFWSALEVITDDSARPMTALAIDMQGSHTIHRPIPLEWANDLVLADESGLYEVRITARALAEMRAEARRGARVRGGRVETGGMLLGAVDEGTQTVHVDVATGPSPDSRLSEHHFDHGTLGTQEIVEDSRATTGNRVGFIGMWHTHPHGVARPSPTDEAGMAQIVSPDGTGRRALMFILGGDTRAWSRWLEQGSAPDTYARIVQRSSAGAGHDNQEFPFPSTAHWFPGGYAYPAGQEASTGMKSRQVRT
jgi:integrative and conjugative element protein (TIGR02256 family)